MANDVKWIKLKVGMFDGESFKKIKRAKIGGESFRDKLTAIWFELMDFAGKCNHSGAFINNREIPYTSLEDIAIMIDREKEELELCMSFFINEGMVEVVDDVFQLANWTLYQNEAGLEKIREQKRIAQAKWRAKKALQAGVVDGDVDAPVDSTGNLPSYSYSSSISNSISVDKEGENEGESKGKEEPPKSAVDYSNTTFSDDMKAKVEEWLQYKKERRETYKPTGLKSLITQIQNNVNQYGEVAVMALIGECMAANYRGIIFDRLQKKGANTNGKIASDSWSSQRIGNHV